MSAATPRPSLLSMNLPRSAPASSYRASLLDVPPLRAVPNAERVSLIDAAHSGALEPRVAPQTGSLGAPFMPHAMTGGAVSAVTSFVPAATAEFPPHFLPAGGITHSPAEPARTAMDPLTKRRIRRVLLSICGVAVVAIAMIVAVTVINSTRGPESVVTQYLEQLKAGNATGAAKIVDPGIPSEDRYLLTDEALKSADSLFTIESVERVDPSATGGANVAATLNVDGQRLTANFTVEEAPKDWLVLNNWRLTTPLLMPLFLDAPISGSASLGDLVIPTEQLGSAAPLYAYPGTYTFTARPSDFLTAEPVTLRVASSDAPPTATIIEEPTDALKSLVLKTAQDFAASCATVPNNTNSACPYSVQSDDLALLTLKTPISSLEEITAFNFRTGSAGYVVQRNASLFYEPDPIDVESSFYGTITFAEDGTPTVEVTGSGW